MDQTELEDYQLARDRTRREIKPPRRYAEADLIAHALASVSPEEIPDPTTYDEAVSSKYGKKWLDAMNEEMDSLRKNKTWIVVPRPQGQKVVSCKWIFRIKEGMVEGEPPRYKARLVAKGFTQVEGIDYTDIFSPVVKYKTIRMMLAVAAHEDLEVEQLDVKTTFLNGVLDEEIYMEQPPGFQVENSKKELVCLLKRSLYGLKQSPRQWNKRFNLFAQEIGFVRSKFDSCLYYKDLETAGTVFLLLYVDDMMIIGRDKTKIKFIKDKLKSEFEMKDLGPVKKILGIEVLRNRNEGKLVLTQRSYIEKVMKKFSLENSKATAVPLAGHFKLSNEQCPKTEFERREMEKVPYAVAVGCLMYIMVSTRPDIAHSLSVLSRYMSNPGLEHWNTLKWLMRYLKGTSKYGLIYQRDPGKVVLNGYVDADYASNKDNRRSTTAYVFVLNKSCISWKSQQQQVVALSTTESEFMATTEAFKEAIWIQGILQELKLLKGKGTIYSDSQSSIHLCKNPVYHEKSKHIDIRLYWIREKIEERVLELEKVHTSENPADMGTKVLTFSKLNHCLNLLNIGSC